MKRTNPNNATVRVPKFDLAIDAETLNELRGLLDQRKKLDDAVSSAPSEIAAGEAELAGLRHQLAMLEADVVLVDDDEFPKLQKQIADLSEVIDAKDLAFRRLKSRLKALEDRAPELDNKIELAIGYVRVDANIAAQNLQAELASELRSKVAEIRSIYAQVRALQSVIPLQQARDFLVCAHVPDLDHCMVSYPHGIPRDFSQNLLEQRDDATEAAESQIAEALKPITDAFLLARKHNPYVPLAKRPVPYVRKGAWDGPGGRTGDRPEQSEQAEAPASSESSSRDGNPRSGVPAEMNWATAMEAAARSSGF
ncbi:hypothetical protein WQE_04902 [Paraburkholderia hospita]|uniref:Uncharacterized protein n=1 Tax=Paraburkholderia hospita TaxID=169430 RepID=A0ABN0FTW5_9BURK|nr:hypothetical protein [Paraburkholderia hospita]EIN02299.1 hypothetical protein WQE_04902 [Paraburkholderia hospita]OUL72639.1 hypothetical protein CA602_42920 [Paraburkholderia hospita]